ncbi:metallophosphoesterase [Duganella sp. FT3S]|uniref:Metallophosphoesterase n=1 Tax=Rugamonas fusca TaxID=2758568 RepID=A0A7W2EL47_9BURK|nr:metallophosphoesterase [Rugamonas fusca]MBA5607920.1 metallophosphoesterase [Rugamonas fusca]
MAMYLDPELEAFLHIVHVSDMHCKGQGAVIDVATQKKVRRIVRALRRLGRSTWADQLEQRWQAGLAGHDPTAHEQMCAFLCGFANYKDYAGVETWLLDTGDLSALGDHASLRTALGWLDDYRLILDASQTLILHGNHDAWPGQFPLAASRKALVGHQAALRYLLGKSWPDTEIHTAIPHANAKLRLYAVNSTIGERWPNTLARGEVGMDPPWAKSGMPQLAQLAQRAREGLHQDGVTRDFRILALHHPVHYPPPRPTLQMSLRNDTAVADTLAQFTVHQRGMLAHLLLSGHTHATYPPHGALPSTSMGQQYPPLYEGQLQLIAGTLSQLPHRADSVTFDDVNFVPHQCQILTFFSSPNCARRGQLLMERRVVGRKLGGPYQVLPLPDDPAGIESIMWEY